MGGRLQALMLCEEHRVTITKVTDEPAIDNFKPLTMFLAVPRQDGKVGAAFKAVTDAGNVAVVKPDGSVPGPRLVVAERAEDNRIKRATGSLAVLDSLMEQGAFAPSGTQHVLAYMEKAPIVNFEVVADESIAAFILKVAFHFIAAFVADPHREVAKAIYPSIVREERAAFKYVSTPSCSEALFPDSWPPRHEVTVYPRSDMTWATVLLYNAYGYLVKFPFTVTYSAPLRYVQPLLGRPDPLLFNVEPVSEIQWEYKITQADKVAWSGQVHKRLDRIQTFCQARVLRAQCFHAAKAALVDASKPGDRFGFWEYYRGRLQLEALDPGLIERLVRRGMELRDVGKSVWDFSDTEWRVLIAPPGSGP